MKKIKELMKLFSYGVSDSIQNALVPQIYYFHEIKSSSCPN